MGKIRQVLFVAFFLRLALLVVNNFFYVLPQGGFDALMFERTSYAVSLEDVTSYSSYLSSGSGAMIIIGSTIYGFLGRVPFVLGLVMVCLGTAVVYNIYKGAYLLWDDKRTANRIAWFAAFFPEMALHSALFLREVPVNFFLSLAIIQLIRFWKFKQQGRIVLFIVFLGIGTLFHSGIITSLAGFIVSLLLLKQKGGSSTKTFFTKSLGIIVVVGGLIFINNSGLGLNKFGGSFETAIETFENNEERDTKGGSAFPEWMRVRGGAGDIWKIPVRMVAFLFAPLIPPMVRSSGHILGLIDAFLYLLMFYNFYKFRRQLNLNQTAKSIFIISITLCLVFSLGVSNFGTAIRHRAKIAPLFLILAVNHVRIERRRRRSLIIKNINEESTIHSSK